MQKIKKENFLLMALKRILHIPARFPYFVQIDITNFCNLSCSMCPVHYAGIPKTHIDFKIFKNIVDNLNGVEEVALCGLGEPLTHPNIMDAIKYCKAKGMIVKTTSNGLLLNNNGLIKDLIDSGLDTITISLESIENDVKDKVAHRDSTVLKNIEKLLNVKEEMKSRLPKVAIQTVMFKDRENDIYEIIKWVAGRKINRINVLRMHMYFDIGQQRPDRKEEKRIFKEFSRLRKKYKVRVDCLQDQFFTGFKGFLYKHLKYLLRLNSFCIRLLDFPLISQKGDMLVCCVLPEHKFGNILEERIENIWHGKKLNNFRKNHNNIERCSRCDCWRIKQVI